MSRKYIVSPLYEISEELLKDVQDGDVVIISDSVSPVFPIDRREVWMERSDVRYNVMLDSIPTNDENADFLEMITKKVESIAISLEEAVEESDIIVYVSDKEAFQTLGHDVVVKQFRAPLELSFEDLDEPFRARFGHEFEQYTKPKKKDIGMDDYVFIPTYVEDGVNYYGLVEHYYDNKGLAPLESKLAKFAPLKMIEVTANKLVAGIFSADYIHHAYLGVVDGKIAIAVQVTKPTWIKDDAIINSHRKFLLNEVDIVFLREDMYKDTSSLNYVVANYYDAWLKRDTDE